MCQSAGSVGGVGWEAGGVSGGGGGQSDHAECLGAVCGQDRRRPWSQKALLSTGQKVDQF